MASRAGSPSIEENGVSIVPDPANYTGPHPEAYMAGLAHAGRLGLFGELADIPAHDEDRRAAYRAGVDQAAASRGATERMMLERPA